ncbi:VOC family protein [Stenotrophomonas sp. G4]|uniref:VOC family protein n=1 Tax=Stenotrophomonas sp. G4 TaxID=2303750 RepID=UPI001F07401E|nr:VOC family protein [Stenotrophomonas sp. G4]
MNPILHVEVPVADLGRAVAFYEHWLQVRIEAPIDLHDCRMAYLSFNDAAAGASMALVHGADYVPSEQGPRLYLGVDDLDRSLQRALQAGAVLCFGPAVAGGRWLAGSRDPRQRGQPDCSAGTRQPIAARTAAEHGVALHGRGP